MNRRPARRFHCEEVRTFSGHVCPSIPAAWGKRPAEPMSRQRSRPGQPSAVIRGYRLGMIHARFLRHGARPWRGADVDIGTVSHQIPNVEEQAGHFSTGRYGPIRRGFSTLGTGGRLVIRIRRSDRAQCGGMRQPRGSGSPPQFLPRRCKPIGIMASKQPRSTGVRRPLGNQGVGVSAGRDDDFPPADCPPRPRQTASGKQSEGLKRIWGGEERGWRPDRAAPAVRRGA